MNQVKVVACVTPMCCTSCCVVCTIALVCMYNQALVTVQHNTAHMSRLYAFDGRCASAEDARPLLACALLLLRCTPQLLLLLLKCLLLCDSSLPRLLLNSLSLARPTLYHNVQNSHSHNRPIQHAPTAWVCMQTAQAYYNANQGVHAPQSLAAA